MRGGLGLLTLILAMAALKAALVVIVAAIGLGLVVSFITRPRDTIMLLATLTLLSVVGARPLLCIVVFGLVALASALNGVRSEAIDAPHPRKASPRALRADGQKE